MWFRTLADVLVFFYGRAGVKQWVSTAPIFAVCILRMHHDVMKNADFFLCIQQSRRPETGCKCCTHFRRMHPQDALLLQESECSDALLLMLIISQQI